MELLLSFEGLAIGYPNRAVSRNLDLRLSRGSCTALLGPNGAGKTTLLKTIAGILKPLAGAIRYEDVHDHAPRVGYVPQRDQLDPLFLLSASDVVLMGALGKLRPGQRLGPGERQRARRCLEVTGAEAWDKQLFSELSGGQKQRVLLARALMTEPDLLLLDEPTSGIDPEAALALMQLISGFSGEGKTVLMVTHDLKMVRGFFPDLIWVKENKLEHGQTAKLLAPEKVAEAAGFEL